MFTICRSGYRALRAAQFLKQVGLTQVQNVRGGTSAWTEAGKPLAFGDTSVEAPRMAETAWTHAGVLDAAGLTPSGAA